METIWEIVNSCFDLRAEVVQNGLLPSLFLSTAAFKYKIIGDLSLS
jgi:hypothetical protein